jgi:hypothetical protein
MDSSKKTEGIPVSRVRDILSQSVNTISQELIPLWLSLRDSVSDNWLSEAGPRMPHGIYDHFKGGVYLTERVALWVDDDSPVVFYVSLVNGAAYCRRCSEWNEVVQWPDGKYRSRFVFRGIGCSEEPSFKVPTPGKQVTLPKPSADLVEYLRQLPRMLTPEEVDALKITIGAMYIR